MRKTPPTLGVQAGLWAYPLAHRVEAFPKALAAKGIGHNIFRTFDRLKTSDDQFVERHAVFVGSGYRAGAFEVEAAYPPGSPPTVNGTPLLPQ